MANGNLKDERFDRKTDGSVPENHFNASQGVIDEDLSDKPTFKFGAEDRFLSQQKLMKPGHIYYQGVHGHEKTGGI